MKNNLAFSKMLACTTVVLLPVWLAAQQGTNLSFGQCKDTTLATQSSTLTFFTPLVQPGDVMIIRVKEKGVKLKFELYSPTGFTPLETHAGVSTGDLLQTIHQAGDSGAYRIIVSAVGSAGNFSIAIEKMNEPASTVFLECDKNLIGNLNCAPIVKTHKVLLEQGSRSRITVTPSGTAPEVWICDPLGNILRHDAKTRVR